MHLPMNFNRVYLNRIYMQKYAKNMHVYAKYVSMKFICILCTSHFADVWALQFHSEDLDSTRRRAVLQKHNEVRRKGRIETAPRRRLPHGITHTC